MPQNVNKEMIDLRLDVSHVKLQKYRGVVKRVSDLGIIITTLAHEHDHDSNALTNLYSLALEVHKKPQWTLDEYLKRFDRWEAVFIAIDGATYAGYTYLTEPKHLIGTLNQCMTGVRLKYRRIGIGTVLKVRGIEYALARGCRTIVTRIHRNNEASLMMNRKMGFVEDQTLTSI